MSEQYLLTVVYSDALGASGEHRGDLWDCMNRLKIALKGSPKRATLERLEMVHNPGELLLLRDGRFRLVLEYNREGLNK